MIVTLNTTARSAVSAWPYLVHPLSLEGCHPPRIWSSERPFYPNQGTKFNAKLCTKWGAGVLQRIRPPAGGAATRSRPRRGPAAGARRARGTASGGLTSSGGASESMVHQARCIGHPTPSRASRWSYAALFLRRISTPRARARSESGGLQDQRIDPLEVPSCALEDPAAGVVGEATGVNCAPQPSSSAEKRIAAEKEEGGDKSRRPPG